MNKKLFQQFIATVSSLKTEEDFTRFFEAILSPNELKEIPTRLELVRLLKKGVSQREIAKTLKVGIATVTRGSIELKKGGFVGLFDQKE